MTLEEFEAAIRRKWGTEVFVVLADLKQVVIGRSGRGGMEYVVGRSFAEVLSRSFREERIAFIPVEEPGKMPNTQDLVPRIEELAQSVGHEIGARAPDPNLVDPTIDALASIFSGRAKRASRHELNKRIVDLDGDGKLGS